MLVKAQTGHLGMATKTIPPMKMVVTGGWLIVAAT